ncbi:proline--tRNA ligase [Buchnera aphidicola str. APS (Acyrthosiphon pisum)]|uniref:Proline--tRNA ligase n=2 Tax=Buchnera aphidicola TaxID=9 RepID=SYP_BUCA5|nr:proline--tRNA ligase [Buchnera aphidicola]B8D7E1.1 RecName: Full=Proline--tRNA ligase; AltName: Full=Prolyl-tRNA synthetase; Short=ProRS [Buchnera aphidicola str. Tuc7 (Acyrthosiphon pisum)]B8D937.1 RecName: Full=Proline--tRNA ligase; AltName: Full=Prolyl-tRNA synthetase; Short=ProRS [Buchnera aphidicola str. 5A (Acyrthosiphon pisum)]ADP66636.1 prolyl-tRNA synthetase [Buchnera aphidicola str. TLW03 (Acyrthosiphon pisum)]ADP67751.1 prolyl-tRNA synthetase [Buchnera aphidicola str. JF98 (Acyrth
MLTSQYLLSTSKDIPYDAKIISHQLMIRSGMIRKTSSGLYVWLPTGMRVLKKIKNIITTEMEKINALEILMPIIQPEYLWKESGRLNLYGEELLRFLDRRKNQFILGPTNEEVVTNFIGSEIHSYKQLPLTVYQIQTKFRDEIRPRFGIIRTREFTMKDAYSFHINQSCLENTYNKFYDSYINIFKKMNLNFCAVKADSGSMGGNISHEFQAFSQNGEDEIVFSNDKLYSSNMNMAESIETIDFFKKKYSSCLIKNKTNTKKSIIMSEKLNTPLINQIQTFLIQTKINDITSIAALLIRGDHELNFFKVEKIDIINKPLVFLNEKEVISLIGVKKEFLGPLGLKVPIIADISTFNMKNFTIGSNINKHFFINVNWNIDLPMPIFKDIRKVTKNDLSPNGSGYLNIKQSIEIGHIFQLGQKYSRKIQQSVKIKNGNLKNLYMGCYGIGITRIAAAVIEQHHDKNGIIWPDSIAPFEVVILPINMKKDNKIKIIAHFLYKKFKKTGIDVILDDRDERPGVMFNEVDLIGIPHQIIISKRSINYDNVEYRERKNKENILINIKDIKNFIIQKLKK